MRITLPVPVFRPCVPEGLFREGRVVVFVVLPMGLVFVLEGRPCQVFPVEVVGRRP